MNRFWFWLIKITQTWVKQRRIQNKSCRWWLITVQQLSHKCANAHNVHSVPGNPSKLGHQQERAWHSKAVHCFTQPQVCKMLFDSNSFWSLQMMEKSKSFSLLSAWTLSRFTSGSRPPLPPGFFFSKSCSFQARETPYLEQFWAQAPHWGQNSIGPPWPKSWIRDWDCISRPKQDAGCLVPVQCNNLFEETLHWLHCLTLQVHYLNWIKMWNPEEITLIAGVFLVFLSWKAAWNYRRKTLFLLFCLRLVSTAFPGK